MFGRKRELDDFSAEIQAHLKLETERLQEQGLSYEKARAAAYRKFGNVTNAQERFYESGRCVWCDQLWQDVRYGVRMFRKSPSFTLVAVITLALGIGTNTAIFSIVSGILLRKPPARDPDRVMFVLSTNRAKGWGYGPEHPTSAPDFLDWQQENRSFEELAAIDPWLDFSLSGQGEPQHVNGMRVSSNFFHLLGISATLGRTFLPGEDQRGCEQEVILSYDLWQSHFAPHPHHLDVIGSQQSDYDVR